MAVYADANGATLMPEAVTRAWLGAANRGLPFGGALATQAEAEALLRRFQARLELESGMDPGSFRVVFTSGAAEANTQAITACVTSVGALRGGRPHVVVGAGSAPSAVECLRQLRARGACQFTVAAADPATGTVTAATLARATRRGTCLITVPAVTPTGALTNLLALEPACFVADGVVGGRGPGAHKARRRRVPLHVDAAVLHGRSLVYPHLWKIDAYSVDAGLVGGPPGFGFLVVREALCAAFDLRALVAGRPLNLPALAATHAALRHTFARRGAKNAELEARVADVLAALRAAAPLHWFPGAPPADLAADAAAVLGGERVVWHPREVEGAPPLRGGAAPHAVVLSPPQARLRLPNTLVLALCNGRSAADTKRWLEAAQGVVCADLSHDAAGLAGALVPRALHAQALRVSLLDEATKNDALAVGAALAAALTPGAVPAG